MSRHPLSVVSQMQEDEWQIGKSSLVLLLTKYTYSGCRLQVRMTRSLVTFGSLADCSSDSRQVLIEQFENVNSLWPLSRTDKEESNHITTHTAFSEYIYKEKASAQKANQTVKSTTLLGLTQFDKWLWRFDELILELVVDSAVDTDSELVEVKSIDTTNLWRLAYLNIKVYHTFF